MRLLVAALALLLPVAAFAQGQAPKASGTRITFAPAMAGA